MRKLQRNKIETTRFKKASKNYENSYATAEGFRLSSKQKIIRPCRNYA